MVVVEQVVVVMMVVVVVGGGGSGGRRRVWWQEEGLVATVEDGGGEGCRASRICAILARGNPGALTPPGKRSWPGGALSGLTPALCTALHCTRRCTGEPQENLVWWRSGGGLVEVWWRSGLVE